MENLVTEFSANELKTIKNEFGRVEAKHYLDHAGTTLYSENQIDFVATMLKENLFCNPHTCSVTGDLIDQVRLKILKSFNADPSKYEIVFTSGTSAGLKTVAECFTFGATGTFSYVQENHTSVLGMREIVQTEHIFVLTKNEILKNLEWQNNEKNVKNYTGNSLVTFSAQCNFSGYKIPLEIIPKIQNNHLITNGKCIRGTVEERCNNYYICLDAASYAATNFLDLDKYSPDFVCISFYKMFGYPTGLGALIVNRRGGKVLKKKFFGGGTVKIAMSGQDFHEKRDGLKEQFEDGTLSFLSIAALLEGFRTIDRLVPATKLFTSTTRISNYVFQLAKYCYNSMNSLKHRNGNPVIKFYNHTDFETVETQGGILSFNILHEDGSFVGFAEVACIAAIKDIILRTGCFCNSGACQTLLKLDDNELKKHFKAGHVCSDYNDLIDGVPTGAVRLSFGYMTTIDNIDAAIDMIRTCYINENHSYRVDTISKSELPVALQHIPERLYRRKSYQIKLIKICVYPVKSCGGVEITSKWELNENGFKYDRNWMIVNGNGMAVTQKTNTKLCLIIPTIDINKNLLQLNFSGYKSICVPLELDESSNQQNTISANFCQTKVCGDLIEGIDCGDDVAKWLQTVLDTPGLRLIQQTRVLERLKRDGSPKEINLSNQAQFLLINSTSVAWLSSKVEGWENIKENDLDGIIKRFRGNLIIETPIKLEEINFKTFRIGNVDFNLEGPCLRCQMICIDQNTGNRTSEPLKTISKEFKGKIKFGIYLSQLNHLHKQFLSCNDEIFVEYNNE